MTKSSERVPLSGRLGFSMGEFGFVSVWQGASLFLMFFYTDIMGISPAIAGLIYLVAMVWDATIDPMVATIVDRTRTKMGRYRPWLLFGALPFGLSYPLAFTLPPSSGIPVWLWALATHIILRTTYTIASMPFNSLQVRLTPDSQERTTLAAFRIVGAAIAAVFIAFITPVFVGQYPDDQQAQAYLMVALIAGGTTFLTIMGCFALVREPEETDLTPTHEPFFKELTSVIPMFLKNPPLIRVFLMIVIGSICLGMFGKNTLYHFKYDMQREDLTVIALVLPAFLLIICAPLWVKVATMTSKRHAVEIGMVIAVIGYTGFFFNPSHNVPVAMAMIALSGIGISAYVVLFWSMLSDTVEYGEVTTGIRAEAKTFGFATFAQKAAVGVNALVLGSMLSLIGFEANTELGADTLTAMKAIMALIPAVGAALIFWLAHGYTLDRAAHAELRAQLDAR